MPDMGSIMEKPYTSAVAAAIFVRKRVSGCWLGVGQSDLSTQLQTQAAHQFRMPDMGSIMEKPDASAIAALAEEEEEIDETRVEPRDIDLLMTQAGVTRGKAVRALKAHNGDIVGAIMELTT